MSASECAAASGSDSTSAPARSVSGSGTGSRFSRYQVSRCTGRKCRPVAMFSAMSAAAYASRSAPATAGSIRTT